MTYNEAHMIVLTAYLWTPEAIALDSDAIDHGKLNSIAEMLTSSTWPIDIFNKMESRLVANEILNEDIAMALLTVREVAYSPWDY